MSKFKELMNKIDGAIERHQEVLDFQLKSRNLDEPRFIIVNKDGIPVTFIMNIHKIPLDYRLWGTRFNRRNDTYSKEEATEYCAALNQYQSKDGEEHFSVEGIIHYCNTRLQKLHHTKMMIPYLYEE